MQLNQITFTRFIAALTVVFFHYGQSVFPANVPFLFENITAGPIAVGYFYVLSGFIMAIAYYQITPNNHKELNRKKYWIARFARIYPVYLLALFLMIAAKYKTLADSAETVTLHLLLLQSWIPSYPITLNTPGWSLSVEAFFYLCFPFLLLWINKNGLKSLTIFCILLWFITQTILLVKLNSPAYAPKTNLHDFIYYNPVMHLSSFLTGLLVGVYFKSSPASSFKKNNSFWLVFSFSIIFLSIAAKPHLEELLGLNIALTNGLLAPAFLLFIVYLSRSEGVIAHLFNWKWMILLGEASYSLYILQKPIHGIYDKVIASKIPLSETLHFYLFLLTLILISLFSYIYFETPLRKYIKVKFN